MKRKNIQDLWWKCAAAVSMILLSATFFNSPGMGDMNCWNMWLDYAKQYGLREGFRMQGDMYPPFALILQIAMQKIWPALSNFVVLRIVNIFYLLVSAALIQILYKDGRATALSFGGFILGADLGYLDIEMVPFVILAFYFLSKEKYILGGVFGALLCLIKFQPLIVLPYVFIWFVDVLDADTGKLKIRIRIKALMQLAIPAALIGAATLLIYRMPLLKALYRALCDSGEYAISPNAFNFGWIVQYCLERFHADLFGPLDNGQIWIIWNVPAAYRSFKYLFVVVYAASVIIMLLQKKKDHILLLKCCIVGYTAYFLFNCGVHENHLFLGAVLMMLLYFAEPTGHNFNRMVMYFLILNVNLFVLYRMGYARLIICDTVDSTLFLAIFNVIFLTVTIGWFLYEILASCSRNQRDADKCQG